jgi:hypothetical protein
VNKGAIVKAKSSMDRQLREIMRMELWELGPQAVRYLAHVLTSDEQIKMFGKGGLVFEVDKYSTRDKLAAAEMVLARTYPTLSAIKVIESGSHRANDPDVDWAQAHREALEIIAGDGTRGNGAVH